MANASNLVFANAMPMTAAAVSMSRTAIQLRPNSLRTRFLPSQNSATTTLRVSR
ncbi:hypothetical protein D3C84_1126210 [compost metagenome]